MASNLPLPNILITWAYSAGKREELNIHNITGVGNTWVYSTAQERRLHCSHGAGPCWSLCLCVLLRVKLYVCSKNRAAFLSAFQKLGKRGAVHSRVLLGAVEVFHTGERLAVLILELVCVQAFALAKALQQRLDSAMLLFGWNRSLHPHKAWQRVLTLPVLFEHQLSLLWLVLIFSTSTILSSLTWRGQW